MNNEVQSRRQFFVRNALRAGSAVSLAVLAKIGTASAHVGGETPPPSGGGATCFAEGTLIETATGLKKIENLLFGDTLLTIDGATDDVEQLIEAGLDKVVLIRRNAIAKDVPNRDLYLTERHAILHDGMLVAVGNLVNRRTIRRVRGKVATYNIRMRSGHTAIFVHNLTCETYYKEPHEKPFMPRERYHSKRAEGFGYARSAVSPIYDMRTSVDKMRDVLDVVA